MNILILTSKNHLYANYVLQRIFGSKVLERNIIYVWEQDAVVPGKSTLAGLKRYIRISGAGYVLPQMMKYIIFLLLRMVSYTLGKTDSVYYPYWVGHALHRDTVNDLKSAATYTRILDIKPDLILSVYSKEIIPSRIIDIPRYGVVNVHPALLPSFRGVSPIFWALSHGAKNVGISLHYIDAGIDTGAIISQNTTPVLHGDSEHRLYIKLSDMGSRILIKYLRHIHNTKQKAPGRKRKSNASYFSLPTRSAVSAFHKHGFLFFHLSELIRGLI